MSKPNSGNKKPEAIPLEGELKLYKPYPLLFFFKSSLFNCMNRLLLQTMVYILCNHK